jgi:hypothetical protein
VRKFVRHPVSVPIDIKIEEGLCAKSQEALAAARLTTISAGGLAFRVPRQVEIGAALTLSIPRAWPDYDARGTVVWCRGEDGNYEAGVQFHEANEAFKARMVAQYCQIEDYRQLAHAQGRKLSSDEAAHEWILQFAEEFANTVGWQ